MNKETKTTEGEIPKPIASDFVIENGKGTQTDNGTYYHYEEVVRMVKILLTQQPPKETITPDEEVSEKALTYMANNGYGSGVNFTKTMVFAALVDFTESLLKSKEQGQKELILWDKINNRESRFWYRDSSGNFYIDLDPHGVDMSGKRKISIAPKHQYEARYKQQS